MDINEQGQDSGSTASMFWQKQTGRMQLSLVRRDRASATEVTGALRPAINEDVPMISVAVNESKQFLRFAATRRGFKAAGTSILFALSGLHTQQASFPQSVGGMSGTFSFYKRMQGTYCQKGSVYQGSQLFSLICYLELSSQLHQEKTGTISFSVNSGYQLREGRDTE